MRHERRDIVVIEDNPNDAELMVRSLKKNNLANKLIVLEDGEQALDYIFCRGQYVKRDSDELPKVVFLDLKLPKVHGLEVLEQLKSNDKTKKIPVIDSRQTPIDLPFLPLFLQSL